MKFLSTLFKRDGAQHSATRVDPARVIDEALTAAGLRAGHDKTDAIRSTIDRALADAGLTSARRAPPPIERRIVAVPTPAPAAPGVVEPAAALGRFLHGTYSNAHGSREYRLYIPAGYDGVRALPLVLMLHGCTQSAEDFALGTGMNALADRHGFLVAYPQQVARENHAKCWNWFRPEDQGHGAGEPSILAGIVEQVATDHRVDADRVFVAGLSAGGAMAVVLARTYPEMFRAVGVHSGVPYARAHDVPSAFAAMQGRGSVAPAAVALPVPTIIFHGDKDHTVAPANADALVRDASGAGLVISNERGNAPGGHAFSREVYADAKGVRQVERWTIHGSGHAWSGGSPAGSYTDPAGPDASEAMLSFFMQAQPAR